MKSHQAALLIRDLSELLIMHHGIMQITNVTGR